MDFEKAFHCFNSLYLDFIMAQMEFGFKWRSWIKSYLSSARASIIINGALTYEFNLERGIRQGDPLLSAFLFILDTKGLNIALEEATKKALFKGILLPNGLEITHHQYADDMILFGSWGDENSKNLIHILRCFELASGLKVNLSKSNIFGFGITGIEAGIMARGLNYGVGSLPFVYLGLSVGALMSRIIH